MTPERIVPAYQLAPEPAGPAVRPEDLEVGELRDERAGTLGRLMQENHRLRTTLAAIETELDRLRQLASTSDGTTPTPVLRQARETAERYLDDAHREASRLVSEARRDADQIIREAHASAEAIEQRARYWHRQMAIRLESHRAGLEQDVAQLWEVEQQYRMRIRADLQDRLHELEDP